MSTWVISAGSEERDYANVFIRHGIAFIGGESQRAALKQIRSGDYILLKRGIREYVAGGRVIERNGVYSGDGDKDWLWDFDGWELPAYCYVEWHLPENPLQAEGLRMGTIYQTTKPQHQEAVQKMLEYPVKPAIEEPQKTSPIDDDKILYFLIEQGLRTSAADNLTSALRRTRLLAEYYYHKWEWRDIREHETRTFLVIPLLLALGWSEQQLKIELPVSTGKVDIACFRGTYSKNKDDVCAIIETKGFALGLDYAPNQARSYAIDFKKCNVVIVTNGYCYKTYLRENTTESFNLEPDAYLNIIRPRDRYPLDPQKVKGALEVLKWLLPSYLLRTNE